MAKSGKERSQELRDREKAKGIDKLVLKLTETERDWIQCGQDIGGYEDHTEFLLAATKFYNDNHEKT